MSLVSCRKIQLLSTIFIWDISYRTQWNLQKMVSAGMTCVKYLLFCFNLLFAVSTCCFCNHNTCCKQMLFQLSGIAILTVGVIAHIVYSHYSSFVYPSYQSAPLVLIIVGVIIFVVAFFGFCGAVKENLCMVVTVSWKVLIQDFGLFGYFCSSAFCFWLFWLWN